ALIVEDGIEAGAGILAVIAIAVWPEREVLVLLAYLALMLVLYPVADIADEFYGAKLAEVSPDHALTFDASLYAWLGVLGFVVAVPAGALLAGVSVAMLILLNVLLSAGGMVLRLHARRNHPVGPLISADPEEFTAVGQPQPARQFLHDVFRSGPASPAVALILQVIGGLTGHLVLLWVASTATFPAPQAMAVVLLVFGVAATVGPLLSTWIARSLPTPSLLMITAILSALNLVWFAVVVFAGPVNFTVGLVFVFLNVTLNKLRTVVLETHRQTFFSGSQYSRVMSWSYAAGAAGTLLGVQLAYALGAASNPGWSVVLALVMCLMVAFVVRSRLRPVSRGTTFAQQEG
ncbi:MAG: MFS transporter, partial [Arthrobacter sp.]|nr:MFS transporter [Arthrobacter sp.]